MNYYTTLDNTAAHNAARTRRKQQLLSSFSLIKIHPFFSTKTSTLYTELATTMTSDPSDFCVVSGTGLFKTFRTANKKKSVKWSFRGKFLFLTLFRLQRPALRECQATIWQWLRQKRLSKRTCMSKCGFKITFARDEQIATESFSPYRVNLLFRILQQDLRANLSLSPSKTLICLYLHLVTSSRQVAHKTSTLCRQPALSAAAADTSLQTFYPAFSLPSSAMLS